MSHKQEPSATLHCPGCRKELKPRSVMDPYVQGLVCDSGHRYFTAIRMSETKDIDRAPQLDPKYPKGLDTPGMIRHWLTDEICRAHLLNNVATMLRRIYEITVDGDSAQTMPPYEFCPRCTLPLDGSFVTPDGWTTGAECKNGHQFRLSSDMWSCDQHPPVNLKAEPDRKELLTYADAYSSDTQARYMHADLRLILRKYYEANAK